MDTVATNQSDDSPFDKESLSYLFSLPQRSGIVPLLLSLAKLLAIPLVFIGGIGVFQTLKPLNNATENMAEHMGDWFLSLLLAGGIIAVGGALWFIHDHYVFNEAPLGNLVRVLFQGIGRGKTDRVRKICTAIIKHTDSEDKTQLPILLSRAVSFQISAETASDEKQASLMAKEAIPLYKQALQTGLKTPLVYFGLATVARIEGQTNLAVDSYTQYLSMRPNDNRTREIMEKCAEKKA